MTEEKKIADLLQQAIDKRRAQLTPEQQEKNRKSGEEFFQAVSNVWNKRPPTPWAAAAMQNGGDYEEIAKAIADRWEQAFADFTEDEEKK